jgi:adenylate cyclase
MFAPLRWLFAWRPQWRDVVGRLLLRFGKRFYVVLAIVFALVGAWDQFVHPFSNALSNASFDWLMRHRPIPYRADPDIVVLDIDEASLAALAGTYGRWPWPRQVLAQVAGKLESNRAQAVVFDILFADPDVQNPASEQAFDRYVSASRRSFFPILRLNPSDDGESQITLSMLNFASRDPLVPSARAHATRTIALVPPYFKSIYDSARVGTHNVYPDADNVVRWYANYEAVAGYRIPSLPYRMAQVLGWPLPQHARGLLNWPRGLTPYRTISFVDAFHATATGDERFFAQLAGKIVMIGSTAPSLNDIKATPVDSQEPGIYALATAIDNTRHGSFLRPLGALVVWIVELLLLVPAAYVFTHTEMSQVASRSLVAVPTVLLAISLLSVSVSEHLADLSVPTALVLSYFAIATLFETQHHDFACGMGVFAPTAGERAALRLQVACLPKSLGRDEVIRVLRETEPPAKVWRPAELGLGARWGSQGWVLWRLAPPGSSSDTGNAVPTTLVGGIVLRWIEVGLGGGADGQFALAGAISRAAEAGSSGA